MPGGAGVGGGARRRRRRVIEIGPLLTHWMKERVVR